MAFDLHLCSPADTLEALGRAIDAAKGGDRFAPVTVVVPTNVAGVMARRALGRASGILGVDMVTLNRLAELLAGPGLAHAKRQPTSVPLLDLTVRQVLEDAPGSFRAVAAHPATVTALRELHQELRMVDEHHRVDLATTSRGREAVRISAAVTRLVERRWYDEADLLQGAIEVLRTARPPTLDRIVLYLPQRFEPLAVRFVRELAIESAVSVVVALTGNVDADTEPREVARQLGFDPTTNDRPDALATPNEIIETTDADDEVRIAVRAIVDAARGSTLENPIPFERMAILWPAHRPYARLVEHHLNADGIAWNGRGGIELTERIAPRLLLDLLDVDRRGLRRVPLFQLLADVPAHDADGRLRRTAEWERVSRAAGVSRDEDWIPRLAALARSERWGESATSLLEFVSDLRSILGHPQATRRWSEWVDWCVEQIENWVGKGSIARFSDPEYRAWEALMSALERLRCLDDVTEPINRHHFRTVLAGELDDVAVRDGRIGHGVTIGSLASASGLDIDLAVVVGAAEGVLPPSPRSDPLLSQADRERGGLAPAEQQMHRLHHALISLTTAAHTIVTTPRGDLRASASNQISRWLDHVDRSSIDVVDSSASGLATLSFAPCERERRLRDRLRAVTSPKSAAHLCGDDRVLADNLAMHVARTSSALTAYDGDLSAAAVSRISGGTDSLDSPNAVVDSPRHAVSPTQIQAWTACPHGYFVQYLLGVRPVEVPDRKISIDARDRGTIQHDALDAFHRDVIDGRLAQPNAIGWTGEHQAALLAHFDDRCDQAERIGRTGRPATWASERVRMRADLVGWLELDSAIARATGVTVLASEREFPDRTTPDDANPPPTPPIRLALTDSRWLEMRGKIDRLDRRGDGTLVVTDHKTGQATDYAKLSTANPTLGGTQFQLPAYATAAIAWTDSRDSSDTQPSPVRAEYSMFAAGSYRRIGVDFDTDVWARVQRDLTDVVDGIEGGWFPQTPEPPGYKHFTKCLFCTPDELDTDIVHARWSSKRNDERISRWYSADPSDPTDPDDALGDHDG